MHIKLDTGMGRLGTADPDEATALLERCEQTPELEAAGAMTHFATADELGDRFFAEQLLAFTAWAGDVRRVAPTAVLHAANSAALLRDRDSHFDMVRPGVALYGMDPFGADAAARELRPAMELVATLGARHAVRAGDTTGYGRRWMAQRDGWIGIVPVGYADGWRRAFAGRADVLVAGVRRPLIGTVSMDSVAVDLGDHPAAIGSEVLLIGERGGERLTVEELARQIGTINYEITCGVGGRVPRT